MSAIRREFVKALLQKRTYIGWAGLFVIPFLITLAFHFAGPSEVAGSAAAADPSTLFFESIRANGMYIVAAALLSMVSFFLPLLASMFGSYTIAGEAENGTLRTMLMQPIRRGTLLMAKWSVANLCVAIGLLLLGLAALISGGTFFGLKPMLLLSAQTAGVGHALGLLAASYAFVFVGMMAVVSLAVLFSTLTNSSLTAVASALVLVIIMSALQSFPVFDFLQPYLFTSHFGAWTNLLRAPIAWDPILKALANFSGWIVGTTGLAYLHFRRKDILS